MKSKTKTTEECLAFFEVEIAREDIDKAFEEVYRQIDKVSNIPGYRVGKAPRELVRKHYAANAAEEVLKRLIPQAYGMALDENKIRPIGLPEISEVGSLEEGKSLFFKAKVDTHPKFKLKNYKAIKVENKNPELSEEEVAKTIENLRQLNSKFIAVENRPAQLGDYVICDMECSVNGKSIHKKRENIWLMIEKESTVPGLNEKLAGMNKGEEKGIETSLPEKYPDKNLAGKMALYHIKIKEIKSQLLSNLDDDFAKDLGKDNLDSLKKEVREELAKRVKANAQADMENQVLKKLIDDNVFQVPARLLDRQLKFMVEDAKERLVQKGFKKEDLAKKDDEFKAKFKDDALRQVRLFFILDEIAGQEHIDVSGADIKEAFKSISAQTGKSEDEVKAYYEKEGLVGDLEEKLREEKTIQFLLKEADVIES